jgi:protein tyrosine phosphatase (PTP) superfamily phosphohydrolase (DUF442 family)
VQVRRIGIITLAVLTLLTPVGCWRHRRCDPPRDTLPRATEEFDPGTIRPRETIAPPNLPTAPGGRRDTFTPTRPAPKLVMPDDPFGPPASLPSSPSDLPRPVESESKKLFDPAAPKKAETDPTKPKKLLLVPDQMPDAPDKLKDAPESKYPPKEEGGKPVPDGKVFPDPTLPGGGNALPRIVEEREGSTRESKASPKLDGTPPAGVSDFQWVKGKANVGVGRKPTPEGYDGLAKAGFKTVVYAHDPRADVAATRAVAEAAGLRFVGIPTAADIIPEAVKAFDAVVAGAKADPVFVTDDTGLRAATLWYAHFRTVDLLNPDTAKVRAAGLGLGDTDANAEQKKLWDAVQEYLAKK